jgi:hypothetical protein
VYFLSTITSQYKNGGFIKTKDSKVKNVAAGLPFSLSNYEIAQLFSDHFNFLKGCGIPNIRSPLNRNHNSLKSFPINNCNRFPSNGKRFFKTNGNKKEKLKLNFSLS